MKANVKTFAEVRAEVLSYLKGGEQLLSWGKPRAGIIFELLDTISIPIMVVWTGVVVFFVILILGLGGFESWPTLLGFVPLLLFGLYFTVGRFIVDGTRRKHTIYIVTDRRLLIIIKWPGEDVTPLDLRKLPTLEVKAEPNGEGTLTFGTVPWSERLLWAGSISMGMGPKPPRFREIPRARDVYEIIRVAREALLHREHK